MENWYFEIFSLKFQIWTFESQAPFFASPCIDQSAGIVWVGSQDGKLFKINIKDGKKIGELYLRSALTSGFISSNPKASFLTICESKGSIKVFHLINRNYLHCGQSKCRLCIFDASRRNLFISSCKFRWTYHSGM